MSRMPHVLGELFGPRVAVPLPPALGRTWRGHRQRASDALDDAAHVSLRSEGSTYGVAKRLTCDAQAANDM